MTAIYIRQRIVNVGGLFQANSPGLQAPGRRVRPDIMRQGGQLSASRYVTPDLPIPTPGRHSGVITGCGVTASAPASMVVTVASGVIIYQDDVAPSVATTNLTIAAADPTIDRTDAIVANAAGVASVIQGAYYDGNNARPPDTGGYVLLAYVYVFNQTHVSYTGTITQDMISGLLAGQQAAEVRPFVDLPEPANTMAFTFGPGVHTAADPGVGYIVSDTDNIGTIAHLYINYVSASWPFTPSQYNSLKAWLQPVATPFYMRLWSRKSPNKLAIFQVTGFTDHGSWADLACTVTQSTLPDLGGLPANLPLSTDAADTVMEFNGPAPSTGVTSTNGESVLGGDVTITTANTFFDAVNTGTLAAGTYLFTANIHGIATGAGHVFTGRIWNGSTTYAEGEVIMSTSAALQVSMCAVVTLGSPTTVKLSATSNSGTTDVIKAAVTVNSAGNLATILTWVRLS